MGTRESIDSSEWLAHAQALRRLASGLVRDSQEAEELVQETWLRARGARRSSSWLRTVLRNLVRDRARSKGRRERIERDAARPEGVPSGIEIVERLEVAQRVAQEVAGLEEPYRVAIHLRYFEGLEPREIAHRCGQPLETTRTHLKRGLERLRQRMDRAHGGDRKAWALVLAPIARGGLPLGGLPLGGGAFGIGGPTSWAASLAGGMMGMKLAITTAVGLAAAGFLMWGRWSPSPTDTVAANPHEDAAPPVLHSAFPTVAEVGTQREERSARPVMPPAMPAVARPLEVQVVIEDERGAERRDEEGTLTFVTGTGEPTSQAEIETREVPFERGRLAVEVAAGEWIAFVRLVAGGRDALLPEPSPVVPGPGPLVLRGEWLARGRLRVLDAQTGAELSGIEVRCAQGWRANPEWSHPGNDERIRVVVSDGASPIDLPDRKWLTPYWVHAPGHAWTRIDFDHRAGGERSIELLREVATVIVTLAGEVPQDAWVRLYALDAPRSEPNENNVVFSRAPIEQLQSWLADASLRVPEECEVRIEDFRPGAYVAYLESGEYEDRVRLGSTPVDLVEGEVARVVLRVDASAAATPRTHLCGTIRLPAEALPAGWTLRLERMERGEKDVLLPLGSMEAFPGAENLLRWDAGELRTGSYLATITGIQHRVVVEALQDGGTNEVRIEIPELVRARIEVLDALTGAALMPERLMWADGDLPGVTTNSQSPLRRDPSGEAWQFLAPGGTVSVHATVPGYLPASIELELVAPETIGRIELERATGVRLVPREGEALVAVGPDYWRGLTVRDRAGERISPSSSGATSEATVFLEEGGRYTFTLPALEGFEPLEPFTLDLDSGEMRELSVSFIRRR